MIEEKKALVVSILASVATLQERIRDKPLQDQNETNYLNSKSKSYLRFTSTHDKSDIIAQERKYILKDKIMREVSAKANFFLGRTEDFKVLFKDIFSQCLQNLWDAKGA